MVGRDERVEGREVGKELRDVVGEDGGPGRLLELVLEAEDLVEVGVLEPREDPDDVLVEDVEDGDEVVDLLGVAAELHVRRRVADRPAEVVDGLERGGAAVRLVDGDVEVDDDEPVGAAEDKVRLGVSGAGADGLDVAVDDVLPVDAREAADHLPADAQRRLVAELVLREPLAQRREVDAEKLGDDRALVDADEREVQQLDDVVDGLEALQDGDLVPRLVVVLAELDRRALARRPLADTLEDRAERALADAPDELVPVNMRPNHLR